MPTGDSLFSEPPCNTETQHQSLRKKEEKKERRDNGFSSGRTSLRSGAMQSTAVPSSARTAATTTTLHQARSAKLHRKRKRSDLKFKDGGLTNHTFPFPN